MDVPTSIPVMTLPQAILFPGALLPLFIYEKEYRSMLRDALHSHRMIGVALRKAGSSRRIPHKVAGLGLIRAAVTRQDGTTMLFLFGMARVQLLKVTKSKPYRIYEVLPLRPQPRNEEVSTLAEHVRKLVQMRLKQGIKVPPSELKKIFPIQTDDEAAAFTAGSIQSFIEYIDKVNDPGQLADIVSCTLLHEAEHRQTILSTVDIKPRLEQVILMLQQEIASQT